MVGEFVQKRLMIQTQILKSDLEFQEDLAVVKKILPRLQKLEFWQKHFVNHNYQFNPKRFDWAKVPLITKAEILKIGLEMRLEGAKKIVSQDALRFLLQSTSGTSRQTGPVLFLKNVDCLIDGENHDKGKRIMILYQGRAISLRDTLVLARLGKEKRRDLQSLVVNPFKFDPRMTEAIEEFQADTVVTFPSSIAYLTTTFPKTYTMLKNITHAFFAGDFLSSKQQVQVKSRISKAHLDLDYIMTEVDSIGLCCTFLESQYGSNAYHPFKNRIVELIDVDDHGRGEVVVTKMDPFELSLIRYRTGDVARAIEKRCKCGNQWTMFLDGRKNMDYIKHLGVLITRAEIEKVLKKFENEVEEWRGEVREVESRGLLLAELTLLIKPIHRMWRSKIDSHLKASMEDALFLTPKKTLGSLVKEKKFMPLKVKVVEDFPITSKKVLLRKIID